MDYSGKFSMLYLTYLVNQTNNKKMIKIMMMMTFTFIDVVLVGCFQL